MTGSWEGNERAIGAVVICDTLQNIVTESPKETFTRADRQVAFAHLSTYRS